MHTLARMPGQEDNQSRDIRSLVRKTLNWVLVLLGLCVLVMLVYAFGWPLSLGAERVMYRLANGVLMAYACCEFGLWALAGRQWITHAKENRINLAVALVAMIVAIRSSDLVDLAGEDTGATGVRLTLLIFIIGSQLVVFLPLLLRSLRGSRRTWMAHLQPRTIVIGSFISLITLGALLLKTPNATVGSLSWIDAFFTSTSAVCVTGLIVVDTATKFTLHGQFVILGLIQLGGLGLMTYTFFLAVLSGEGISLHDRVLLRDVISERSLGFVSRTLLEIVLLTLVLEATGAALLYFFWAPSGFRVQTDIWDAIFHSVSAFCNAGFSTLTGNLADPRIVDRTPVQAVIMCLIVLGGLGFPVLRELRQRALARFFPGRYECPKRMTLHSRIVLWMTGTLLVGGAVLLLLCQLAHLSELPFSPWRAMFDSVTARTAGFNIADIGAYSTPVIVALMLFMFIGGSPAGTAGGIKTTTFALALLNLWTIVRGKKEIQVGWRSVPQDVATQAFAVLVISLMWISVATFALTLVEPTLPFLDLLFEEVSAFGTVGLSRGITPILDEGGKMIIILSMFIGRIGLIVIAYALLHARRETRYHLPSEPVGLT